MWRSKNFRIRLAAALILLSLILLPFAEDAHEAIPHTHPWEDRTAAPIRIPAAHAAPASAPGLAPPLTTGPMATGTESFLETFDDFVDPGNPPVPWASNAKWDVLTHSRDRITWGGLEAMTVANGNPIHHGDNCESPDHNSTDATHDAGTWPPVTGGGGYEIGSMPYAQANFLCRDHMMTAIKAGGYALLFSTPSRMVQIPADGSEAVIRLDVSTYRSSSRDWIDIWLTPWADNLPGPFNFGGVDLHGGPRNGFAFRLDSPSYGTEVMSTWMSFRSDNGTEVPYRLAWQLPILENFFVRAGMACVPQTPTCTNSRVGTSKSRRDTVEIRISQTNLKIWLPDYNAVFLNVPHAAPLHSDQYVVQFGQHSYNPGKAFYDFGEINDDGGPANANTWHWDNFSISPATSQFTAIHANERAIGYVNGKGCTLTCTDTYTFPTPAPANSYFRALIYGTGMEYRVNGAGSWITLPIQMGTRTPVYNYSHKNYFAPIPEGTTSIELRQSLAGGYGDWGADYAAIWSTTTSSEMPATPTPTNTPLVPNTPTPTLTPTFTPTPTNTPTNTPTPVPTNTPAPDINNLTDDFQDNNLDPTKWVVGNLYSADSTGYVVAETNQELRITAADTSVFRTSGIRSINNYNLTGREAYVHVKQIATQAGGSNGMQTQIIMGPNASNWFRMVVDNGQISCSTNTANSEVLRWQTTYSPAAHAWWRIRELDGDFYCDTSADSDGTPNVWVNRARFTRPSWSLTGVRIDLNVLTYVTVSGATAARFDGFNMSDEPGAGQGRPRRGGLTGVE